MIGLESAILRIVDFTYNYTSCDIACSVATTEPRPTGDIVDGGISSVTEGRSEGGASERTDLCEHSGFA